MCWIPTLNYFVGLPIIVWCIQIAREQAAKLEDNLPDSPYAPSLGAKHYESELIIYQIIIGFIVYSQIMGTNKFILLMFRTYKWHK